MRLRKGRRELLRPTSAEGTGVRVAIPVGSSHGSILGIPKHSTGGDLILPPALSPRDVGVPAVVAHQVAARLGNVHNDSDEKLGRVEGLGRIAPLPGTAVVASLRPIEYRTIPTPLDPLEADQ